MQKARLFGDAEAEQLMLERGADPREVKRLGREVRGFAGEVWDQGPSIFSFLLLFPFPCFYFSRLFCGRRELVGAYLVR